MKNTLILISFLVLSTFLNAQGANINWNLVFDGQNDVYVADLAVDSKGNTYVAINYTSNFTVPILNKKLPYAPHVHGLIVKINENGKPIWAHPFKSDFDNRIKDIAIAHNDDLLVTGFGDGLLCFPGKKDTLKVGKAPKKHPNFSRFQGFYAARYTPDGDRKWVQYFNCLWGEGMSIEANNRDEVYMTFYHKGSIEQNETIIDSFPKIKKNEAKKSIAKFSGKGKLLSIQNLGYEESDGIIITQRIKFDNQDNMFLYGTFKGKIFFSEKDSLSNDKYYESIDSYLAKYNAEGKFLWAKKIGGQNVQTIKEIAIASDNSIYATGMYSFECLLGDAIKVVQKSKYEWKSGNNFFYFHLFDDGELDFIRFEENAGYDSYITGNDIAIDQNEKVHIVGNFNDTLRINGNTIATWHHNQNGFYSLWDNQTLEKIEKIGEAKSFFYAWKIAMNKGVYSIGGEYYGDSVFLTVKGKKVSLSNKKHGRVVSIYGGKIPDKNTLSETRLAKRDVIQNNRVEKIEALLTCTKPDENPDADNWFSVIDSTIQNEVSLKTNPCGLKIKGMEASLFPNPTAEELNIKLVGMEGVVQLDVYTTGGSLILSQRLEDVLSEQTITFNVSQLSSGNYFVKIGRKNHEKSLRFTKVN
jgi:hypothetical protein